MRVCGHECSVEPTPEQDPQATTDRFTVGLVAPKQPRNRTEREPPNWTAAKAARLLDPRFTASPMRDREHRKQRWVKLFKERPFKDDDGKVAFTTVQHPWTTPTTMREWAHGVFRREDAGEMPWVLRMDLANGMTPQEALETADDIERDGSLRSMAACIDDKILNAQ